MSTTGSPPKDAGKGPGQSSRGVQADQERKDRLAQQLRANLAKRKQQQCKRDTGPDEGGAA
tara:strand:- start:36 stop:218 length:183 start_codon:yes stop_codon:yes gene_type:complete